MSDWIVPSLSAILALAGGVYATRGKKATDRGDLADRLVDQVQEERNRLQEERDRHKRDLDRERYLRHRDADYIVRLRRQVEACGRDPEPYPGMEDGGG